MKNRLIAKLLKSNNLKSCKGFTILELLVVISVVSILLGGLVTLINPATQLGRSRDGTRKSDLSQIRSALEFYRSDLGAYPLTIPACGSSLTGGSNTYMVRIPCDPQGGSYSYSSPGPTYCIRGCLENTTDPQRDLPSSNPVIPGCTLGACAAAKWSITYRNP